MADKDKIEFRVIGMAMKPVVTGITQQIRELKTIAERQHRRITQLESAVADQQEELDVLKKELNSKERQEKIKSIKITGVKCDEKNTQEAVSNFLQDKLGIEIGAEEYKTRPIFQRNKTADWPRPSDDIPTKRKPDAVMVTFNNVWKKRQILAKRRNLRGSNIYLNEDLPKFESELFFKCRKLRQTKRITTCYTHDLTVYIVVY